MIYMYKGVSDCNWEIVVGHRQIQEVDGALESSMYFAGKGPRLNL